jgi:hypothetical protein
MVAVGGLRRFTRIAGVNTEVSERVSRKEDCAGRLSLLSGRTQLILAGKLIEDITRDFTEGDRSQVLCRRSG